MPKMTEVQRALAALADPSYAAFHRSLLPSVEPALVLGVRMPAQRKFARQFAKSGDVEGFLRALPHTFYEENNLHMLLIGQCRNFSRTVALLDEFLPYVDNWATCDLPAPAILGENLDALLPNIDRWLASPHPYTVRYAIGLLMRFYLDDAFTPAVLARVAAVRSEEYYVNMMIAWFFATALAKRYNEALPYLREHRLAPYTHGKTIQKAVESYRLTLAQKDELRTLRLARGRQASSPNLGGKSCKNVRCAAEKS